MKTLLVILLIAAIGWTGWYYWGNNNNNIDVSFLSPSSSLATPLGQGGQGIEPEDFIDSSDDSEDLMAEEDEVFSPAPARTPIPVIRIARTPVPTSSPTPTTTLYFRDATSFNGSGQSGVVVLSANPENQSQTTVDFNLAGGPVGIQQPAYIYSGVSCGSASQLVYSLNPVVGGSSMTVLPVSINNLVSGQGSLWIVVHQSPDDLGTRFACAQIR